MSDEKLVVTPSTPKKIGFFSAILIVLGGSIGAGIFLRSKGVLENSGGNLIWAIIVWLIAGFTVVTMALGLVEVASGRNDNLGMIGWAKAFNTLKIYKATKFFMTYLYLPFTYFFMPYYVILQFQDGISAFNKTGQTLQNFGGSKLAPWFYFLIALALTVWMVFSAGISSRAGNIQNWVVTAVKFIPLVAVVIIGFTFAFIKTNTNGGKRGIDLIETTIKKSDLFNLKSTSFFGLSPFFAVFASLGGIFFAFDGFYVTAGVQSEMKNPEKTPAALTIGLSSMTAIYILIAVSMSIGAKSGGFYDYGELLAEKKQGWAFGVINFCIAIGIIGILNGFTMWASRWVEDLIKEGEISVPVKVYKYMKNSKMPLVGALFVLFLALPFMIIFTIIGAYGYKDITGYNTNSAGEFANNYGLGIGKLLSFSDLMANWMAVFAFAFIAMSIVGAIQNRKKHFIAVTENKHTKWAGTIAVIMVLTTMAFLIIDPFATFFIALGQYGMGKDVKNDLLASGLTSLSFIVFCVIAFGSAPIERKLVERKAAKFEKLLASGTYEADQLETLKIANELNNTVLRTYTEARVN